MQNQTSKSEMREMFFKLRGLSDALGAVLTSWRDVERYAAEHGYSVVPDDCFSAWFAIATHAITDLKWLGLLDPTPNGTGPDYWQAWQQSLLDIVLEHLNESLAISRITP